MEYGIFGSSTKILLVDDDRMFIILAKKVLQLAGFDNIADVSSVREAIDKIEKEPPDIVVMDLNFSHQEEQGREGIKALKSGVAKYIPIIAMSMEDDLRIVTDVLYNCGADRYVVKNFMAENLLQEIKDIGTSIQHLRSKYGVAA